MSHHQVRSGRSWCVLGGIAVAMSVFSIHSAAVTKEFPPAVAKVVEAAKTEGKLKLVWGSSTLSGAAGAKLFEEGFNAYYGTKHSFKYTPGKSFPGMAFTLIQESQAGRPAFTDLLIAGSGASLHPTVDSGVLLPVDWAALMPFLPAGMANKLVSPDRSVVTFVSRASTIVYNTNFVKPGEVPKGLTDLLNPKWKGKIASTPYAYGFDSIAGHKNWGEARTLDFADKFAGQLAGLMRCGEDDRITSGEFWIFAIACEPGRVAQNIASGAPLGQVTPNDILQIEHWFFGVPKLAENPNTAKLFIAWLLTPQGQKVLFQNQGEDLHYLEGSQTRKILAQVAKDAGTELEDLTIELLMKRKEYAPISDAVAKIFREKKN